MIKVNYLGRLGNNLFQYCLGRILAEELGYELDAIPIPGFPNTSKKINGNNYSNYSTEILRGQLKDLAPILKNRKRRKIVLNGYFQKFDHYKKYREIIKSEWLITDIDEKSFHTDPEDVVLCVRRGDYVPKHALPFSYYEEALSQLKYRKVFICTDEPDDPFNIILKLKYRATIVNPNPELNLAFIKSFNKIVISSSTFCWWAAFLSKAEKIYAPLPIRGFWSRYYRIDLRILDEERYTFLKCKSPYETNFLERLIGFIQLIYPFQFKKRQKLKKKLGIKSILPLIWENKS